MKILFTGPRDINATPAFKRAIDSIPYLNKHSIHIVDWTDGPQMPMYDHRSYKQKKTFFNLICWQFYLCKILLIVRPNVIFNMSILSSPAILLYSLFNTFTHIYDCRDYFAVSYKFPKILKLIFQKYDIFYSHFCKLVIFPDDYGYDYFETRASNYVVIPNTVEEYGLSKIWCEGPIRLGYFGYFSEDRNIKAIFEFLASHQDVELHVVCNYIPHKLITRLQKSENIIVHNRLSHYETQKIMCQMDYCLIMYNPNLMNYKFIKPTKFYDCLALGLPFICSKGMVALEVLCDCDNLSVEYGVSNLGKIKKTYYSLKNREQYENYKYINVINIYSSELAKVLPGI